MGPSARRSRGASPRPLGGVVRDLLGPRALGRTRRVNREIMEAWCAVAGEELACQTRIGSLRRGVLTIEVESSPLCHQLASFRRQELLLALKERLRATDLQEIRFKVGTLA